MSQVAGQMAVRTSSLVAVSSSTPGPLRLLYLCLPRALSLAFFYQMYSKYFTYYFWYIFNQYFSFCTYGLSALRYSRCYWYLTRLYLYYYSE
jgi:hypothetical protein